MDSLSASHTQTSTQAKKCQHENAAGVRVWCVFLFEAVEADGHTQCVTYTDIHTGKKCQHENAAGVRVWCVFCSRQWKQMDTHSTSHTQTSTQAKSANAKMQLGFAFGAFFVRMTSKTLATENHRIFSPGGG